MAKPGTTDADVTARKLGYKKDQQGIINRYINEEGKWDAHLNNCKKIITTRLKSLPVHLNVSVLGSGWLLDIPILFLSEKFNRVNLFDLSHPREIQKKYQRLPNVSWQCADITGGFLNFVYKNIKQIKTVNDILKFKPNQLANIYKSDIVLSVNLLSQLDELLINYIRKKKKFEEQEFEILRKTIQTNHLQFISKHQSVLITDTQELFYDHTGNLKEKNNLVFCQLPAQPIDSWTWDFDYHKTYHQKYITRRSVEAFAFA